MEKFPSLWQLKHLFDYCAKGECASSSDGVHYYPARPSGFCSIGNRVRCAWLVFTGRADAVIWDDGQ
jgi:hypothetical protein